MHGAELGRLVATAGALLVALLGSVVAHAQPRPPVVGNLIIGAPFPPGVQDPLIEGLRRLGYRNGQEVRIEQRWAHGDITRYPRLAREVIEFAPFVMVAPCGPSQRATRELSRTLPIIAICADERNFLGEVASIARPGGYTTGATFLSPEAVAKRLELLTELIPGLSRLAVLYEPDDPIDSHWRELERLRPALGLTYLRMPVVRADDLEPAFDAMVRQGAQAVFVFPTNLMIGDAERIAALARKHRLPSVFEFGLHVDAGGLLSYGASIAEVFHTTVAPYVVKILNGVPPGELPIVQPSRMEMIVNLRTARALGLGIPPNVLLRADRVID